MPPSPVFRRAVQLTAFTACACPSLFAQEMAPGAPLELPKYTVTAERDLPPPESWQYARIPGFEVLASGSERTNRDLLNNFQRFINAVDLVWPGMVPHNSTPAILVICGSGDQFAAFLPEAARGAERATASLALRAREQSAIVLDRQTKVLNLVTAENVDAAVTSVDADGVTSGSGASAGFAVDTYQQLYREYLRYLLAGAEAKPPAWFSEGLAQLFMAMQVTETSITLGKLEDPNETSVEAEGLKSVGASQTTPQRDRDFNAMLAKRALLPLSEIFAVTDDSPTAVNSLGSTWAKESYAFVHWGLYGDQGIHQKDFLTFVTRLGREAPSETLFKECFKKSYQDMLLDLRTYIEFTRHKVAGVRAAKGQKLAEPPPVVLREATQAEIGRLKGEALLLAGQPPAARTTLLTPYLRGERDPALLAALGIAEANGGDAAKARKFLEAAAAAHVVRPRAYVELARLRLADARAHPEAAGGKNSIRQTGAVLEPLFTARSQPPALPELYELIAEAWTASDASPNVGQLAVLDEGVRFNPRNASLVYADAALKAKIGQVAEAESLIRLGLRVAPDNATRAKFEALKAGLPPAPAK